MASADHVQDYPPELSEERLMDLIAQIKVIPTDHQLTEMRLTHSRTGKSTMDHY